MRFLAFPRPMTAAWLRHQLAAWSVGVPLLAAWWALGALEGFPTNDDPFYGRPAQILADQSRFQLVTQIGELSASSVTHILIGGGLCWVLGFGYRHLFLAVILQLWLAGIALYALARRSGCSRAWAWFWASVLLANPLCFAHAFTFMTDAPAMSWGVYALYFFHRGVAGGAAGKGGGWQWLAWLAAGSLAVGVAFWMRQTHVLYCGVPLVGLTWLWWRGQFHGWAWWWGVCSAAGPAALAVALFESGWLVFGDVVGGPGGRLHVVAPRGINWHQTLINVYGVGCLLGFLTLPALPMLLKQLWGSPLAQCHLLLKRKCASLLLKRKGASPPVLCSKLQRLPGGSRRSATKTLPRSAGGRWWREASRSPRLPRWLAGGVTLVWLLPLVLTQGRACVTSATGTVIANAHFGPIFLSDFEDPQRWGDMGGVVWPLGIWSLLTAVAIVQWGALVGCTCQAFQRWTHGSGQSEAAPAIALGLLVAAVPMGLVILSVRTGVLDRYWMLVLPVLFALLPLLLGNCRCRVGWWASGLLLAQLSLSLVFARDFLVWNQARWQQVQAWLDAGYLPEEIDGGRDVNAWFRSAEDYQTLPRAGDTSIWWSGRAKVALAIGPRSGWQEIGRVQWRAWATGGSSHDILLLQRASPP